MAELSFVDRLANHLDANIREHYEPIQKNSKVALETDEITPLTMNKEVFHYYHNHIKGNNRITLEMAELKLTRSRLLAFVYRKDVADKKNPRVWYAYGSMRFMVQDNEVKWIQNNCKQFPMWYLDVEKYTYLSKVLGIDGRHIRKYSVTSDEMAVKVPVLEVIEKSKWYEIVLKRIKSIIRQINHFIYS